MYLWFLFLLMHRVCHLDEFSSLTSLNLSHNRITDISFLRNVNTLVELNLSMNDIADITALPSLVSLSVLHLNDNKVIRLRLLFSYTFW